MKERTKGVFEQWKEEQRKQGEKQGEKNIILELLKTYPIDVVSTMIHKSELEIRKIIEID